MAHSLNVLELDGEIQRQLEAGGVLNVHQLRDSTLGRLDACGLTDDESKWALDQLDLWLDRRFRSQVLFPMLPEPCHYVDCAFLPLGSDLLVSLEAHGFQYLYEVALNRRPRLVAKLGSEVVTELEAALARFLESYRQGEIVLHVEHGDENSEEHKHD